ncbi:hypothetical protein DPSP01_006108 [Paraphaeosphaeria sporulosa]
MNISVVPSSVVRATKCFNVMDHPSASSGTPSSSLSPDPSSAAIATPAAQTPSPANTPPPGCTPPTAGSDTALAIRQNDSTSDPCKCVPGAGHPGAVYLC